MHLLYSTRGVGGGAARARRPTPDAPVAARRRPAFLPHAARDGRSPLSAPSASAPSSSASSAAATTLPPAPPSAGSSNANLTKRMFDAVDARQKQKHPQQQKQASAGGAGGRTTYDALLAADDAWRRLRSPPGSAGRSPAPQFVRRAEPYEPLLRPGKAPPPQQQFDLAVCGGTLGVFLAAALARRGWRVAVLERGPLQGRAQEWNLSRAELRALARAGAFESEADAEAAVVSEFNPVRVGFYDSWSPPSPSPSLSASSASSSSSSSSPPPRSKDIWARDVLNLGLSPDALVRAARRALEARGGRVFERASVDGLSVHPDAVGVRVRGVGGGGGGGAVGSSSNISSQQQPQEEEQVLTLSARVVIDCLGHASPAARQLRGSGARPDGVCLVVGGCASGFDPSLNATADVIATAADAQDVAGVPTQLFWEAFPAAAGAAPDVGEGGGGGGGSAATSSLRTTYMFAYMDADAWRPSLAAMFDAYWRLMPEYQRALIPPPAAGGAGKGGGGGGSDGASDAADAPADAEADADALLASLTFERLLFGVFPTYRASPLKPGFDRVLQVGDASGLQSPLSFGGLAALARHLPRLADGLDDALACGQVTKEGLGQLAPYAPNLSAAWMLQRAMTASRAANGSAADLASPSSSSSSSASSSSPPPQLPPRLASAPPSLINRMLGGNFQAMSRLGDRVSRPFLQDVLRPGGLTLTLAAQMIADPLFVPPLLLHLGPGPLADFSGHFVAMAAYDALYRAAGPAVRFLAGEGSCRAGEGGGGGGGLLATLGAAPAIGFRLRRLLDAWKYGSGMDYEFDE